MPIKLECIITGCELVDPAHPYRYYHGDLHRFGDMLIFNAVTNERGWVGEGAIQDFTIHSKIVTMPPTFFQRRGVFVFHRPDAELNDVARAYVGGRL